jgi:hypothetical protein
MILDIIVLKWEKMERYGGLGMKKEYSVGRKIGKGVEDLKRIIDSDYDFKFPLIYIRRHKENLIIITESEFNRLKKIEKEKSE